MSVRMRKTSARTNGWLSLFPKKARLLRTGQICKILGYYGKLFTLKLPDGNYTVEFSRGPESILQTQKVTVNADTRELEFKVQRWVDPAQLGWWSGELQAGSLHYGSFGPGRTLKRACLEQLTQGQLKSWQHRTAVQGIVLGQRLAVILG